MYILAVYYVDSEGVCVPGKLFSVGSGSPLAYSVLDTAFADLPSDVSSPTDLTHLNPDLTHLSPDLTHLNPDLTRLNRVVDIAVSAVRQATYRDSYSGGFINVLQVNATGIYHLKRVDARASAGEVAAVT